MTPKVVTYGTTDAEHTVTGVERIARRCRGWAVPHDVDVLPAWSRDRGTHCCYKPRFILDRLDDVVLWLDADTTLVDVPVLPDAMRCHDVGTVCNPFGGRGRIPTSSAVIAFAPTAGAVRVLLEWERLCAARRSYERPHDHWRLVWALRACRPVELDVTACLAPAVVPRTSRGRRTARLDTT